jgi:hypothetical protein
MSMRPSSVRYMSRGRTMGTGPIYSVAYQTNPGGRMEYHCSALSGIHGVPLARCICFFCLRWTLRTIGLPTTRVYRRYRWTGSGRPSSIASLTNVVSPTDDRVRRASTSLWTNRLNAVRPHSSVAIPAASTSPAAIPSRRNCSHRVPLVGHHDPEDLWVRPGSRTGARQLTGLHAERFLS